MTRTVKADALTAQMEPVDSTRGDRSQGAVGGSAKALVGSGFIPFPTPGNEVDERPLGDIILDIQGQEDSSYISPPEDVERAYALYRLAPYLEAIFKTLCTNVYGAGYSFRPRLNLDRPGAVERVRAALELEATGDDFEKPVEISNEDVEAEINRLRTRAAREREFLLGAFSRCTPGELSYHEQCWVTGIDLELRGDAYWEILRDAEGRPVRWSWVPAWSIRAQPQNPQMVAFNKRAMRSIISWQDELQFRRFRSYIQLSPGLNSVVGRFKEYGDPRVMSRRTGKFYATLADLQASPNEQFEDQDGNILVSLPATELLVFSLPYPESCAYGRGEWSSSYPGLLGARELDELNKSIVTDQEVAQLLIAISGGRGGQMAEEMKRLASTIAEQKQTGGRGIYYIHAYDDRVGMQGPSTTPTIHIEKTKDVQHDDALGLKFKQEQYNQVRTAYRLGRLSLGDTEGVDKSTGMLSLRQTEEQVHEPRRELFAGTINKLLVDMGIEALEYHCDSRAPKDPREMADIVKILSEVGMTPDEAREIAGEIFNKDYKDLHAAWSRMPSRVLTAILQTKNQLTAAALLSPEEGFTEALKKALLQEFGSSMGGKVQGEPPDDEDEDADPEGDGDAVEPGEDVDDSAD